MPLAYYFFKKIITIFLGLHPQHMEVPKLGVLAYTEPQQCRIQAVSATYTTAHGNTRSLAHWVRPGIEPASSGILGRIGNTPSAHPLSGEQIEGRVGSLGLLWAVNEMTRTLSIWACDEGSTLGSAGSHSGWSDAPLDTPKSVGITDLTTWVSHELGRGGHEGIEGTLTDCALAFISLLSVQFTFVIFHW